MKLGIMQPYFLPYIGYFQLIKAVDKYVVFDDVNYIMRGWINRNNFLVNGEKILLTISLKKSSSNRLINQIEIADNFTNFMKTVQQNYGKAPYFKDVYPLLERIVQYDDKCLSRFNANSIKEICNYLGIDTTLLISSDLPKDCSLKGMAKGLEICRLLKTDVYINAIGGQKIYKKEDFSLYNIELYFLQTDNISYKQFNKTFISNLSILDVLMFNSVKDANTLLDKYKLI